jgi:hypothetical protein
MDENLYLYLTPGGKHIFSNRYRLINPGVSLFFEKSPSQGTLLKRPSRRARFPGRS